MNKALKRICVDISELEKDNIENVYYRPDEDDIYKGYALIFGCEDTPYAHGAYMFQFQFTDKYPFVPPKVKFITFDGYTRFNPNLYRDGKVCLSILNTWTGEKWSSCQSIRTVLLNLQMVLNEKPILNEPGISSDNIDFIQAYNDVVKYKNIETAILKYLDIAELPPYFQQFHPIITSHFLEHYDSIFDTCLKEKSKRTSTIGIYSMHSFFMNYTKLCDLLQNQRSLISE